MLVHNSYYPARLKADLEASDLTESASKEEVVISAEAAPSTEKIAERNTIVYETRIEPNVIETIGEKTKARLFARFGFIKPKPEEIQLVSIDKYYEPYMVVSGRYFVDYYRKCMYTIEIDDRVREIILLNQKHRPSRSESSKKNNNVLKLQGEERLTTEIKASLVLDKFGQEVSPEELTAATPEKNPEEILEAFGVKDIAQDSDLNIIRSKILKRPTDINRLVAELLEISERAIIYSPRLRVLYTNVKTGEMKAVEFDGVTAQRIRRPRPLSRYDHGSV